MLTKRIIPCLDVNEGRVVKGTNFVSLRDAGDPVELARRYNEQNADELVFLDICASHENRKTLYDMVEKVAKEIFIPFTVGGGISSIDDIRRLLNIGADKVSINSSAIKDPDLISEASKAFGSQCVVVAIDVKKINNSWNVFVKGGRENTGKDAIEWALYAQKQGAGEILLTSMDTDGTKSGFDLEITEIITSKLNIPVIASGGAGTIKDILDVFKYTDVDAALAASIFHYSEYSIDDVKKYLRNNNIEVR